MNGEQSSFQEQLTALSRRVEALEQRLLTAPAKASAGSSDDERNRQIFTLANGAKISADNRRICPLCGRASRNVNALRRHIVRNHADEQLKG